MTSAYEELKAGMRELAVIQDLQLREQPIRGQRYVLPLDGREIMVICYPGQPEDPVMFCCYGGGFIMGSAVNDDTCWVELQEKMGVTVISIAYRKAPNHPFPDALYDVYDSIDYIQSHSEDFGIRTDDWSVFGFSAGGNLAATVCLLDAQRGGKLKLRRQILNYPYVDLATGPKDKGHPESERLIYTLFPEYYCGEKDPHNPLISPVYAAEESLKILPRAIVLLGERDPLLAEGVRYAAKLSAAGVPVDSLIAREMPHGFMEVPFQEPGFYLTQKDREQLADGSMAAEKDRAIEFIKMHF